MGNGISCIVYILILVLQIIIINRNPAGVPIWEHGKKTFRKKITAGKRLKQKIEISIGSCISKFKRPVQRYGDFKLIIVNFLKTSKTAVVLLAGVTISVTPCPRNITVPFGAEAPSGHVA